MQKQTKNLIVFAVLISILIAPSFALAAWWNPFSWGFWGNIWNSIFHKQEQQQVQTIDTKDWKVYLNSKNGFSFNYPVVIKLTENDNGFSLSHSVPFKHSNPCNLKDGASIDFINDFNVLGAINDNNINNVIRSENYYGLNFDSTGKPIVDADSVIKEYKNGGLSGYLYSMGVEGCGVDVYYLAISNNKTLVIRDSWVGEFSPVNGYTGQYDKIAGIILPDKHNLYLKQIFSTFKFTASPDQTIGWKTYTNTSLGISMDYPATWTYQEISCNIDGVAFCPIKSGVSGCAQTCSMNNQAPPISFYKDTWVNTKNKQNSFRLNDINYKDIFDQMLYSFKSSASPTEGDSRLITPDCLIKNPNLPERNWCYEIYHNGQWMRVTSS